MKQTLKYHLWLVLAWLLGAMPALAADRFYTDAANIEPGETRTLAFELENSMEVFGFQADITLPEGLNFVTQNGKPDCKLSSRTDASYTLVTNMQTERHIRLGAFSTTHTAITGNSGTLLYIQVRADDDFSGGALEISDILLVNGQNNDLEVPDYTVEIGTNHRNSFYIPDFKMFVGETKTVSIFLDNETPFTAFQTDIYLPEGLKVVDNSFEMTSRGANGHTLSVKSFDDGRTRVACISLANDIFSGNSGALVNFLVMATKDAADVSAIELKNQIFSTVNAKERVLPNAGTTVRTERSLVESITLSHSLLEIKVGDVRQITATVSPAHASTKDVAWSSSDETIATVSADGVVTAQGVGTVTIKATATDGSNVTATCDITVSPILAGSITLQPERTGLKIGETTQISATVYPENTTDKTLTWSSSDEKIATVSADGVVTAQGVGTVTIKATATDGSNVTATCDITVSPILAGSITLQPERTRLEVGESTQISATVYPENTTDRTLTWSSSDEKIATVSADGIVTGVKVGRATVTVTACDGSGVSANCTIEVTPTFANSIVVEHDYDKEPVVMEVGDMTRLFARVLPETATDKNVTWSSQDDRVVTVDDYGLVTAVGLGETNIIASHKDGVNATVAFKVVETPVESIILTANGPTTLKDGETVQLSAKCLPSNATYTDLVWTSSDESITTVADGLVTAHSQVGTAYITAYAQNGVNAVMEIHVEATEAKTITIQAPAHTMNVNETMTATAAVLPATTTDKHVIWSTSDETVVTIDQNGLIKAITPGEAYIYAQTTNGITDKFLITVNPILIKNILLNAEEVTLNKGDFYQFTAEVFPEDATEQLLVWTTSDSNIGVIDENGIFEAKGTGQTTVTCHASDGSGISASCNVTVVCPVSSISLNKHDVILYEGETFQLTVSIEPADATQQAVEWSSSDTSVAMVDTSGFIEALAPGETTISVKTLDGSSLSDVCHVTVKEHIIDDIASVYLNDIEVSIDGETLFVKHLPTGTHARLIDINGSICHSVTGDGKTIRWHVRHGMVYILTVGNISKKILVP